MSDWTRDEVSGRSNSSPQFLEIVDVVRRLILDEAHALIRGNTEAAARLIVAQLAHVHGMAPTDKEQTE